jgi:hypothetical protein
MQQFTTQPFDHSNRSSCELRWQSIPDCSAITGDLGQGHCSKYSKLLDFGPCLDACYNHYIYLFTFWPCQLSLETRHPHMDVDHFHSWINMLCPLWYTNCHFVYCTVEDPKPVIRYRDVERGCKQLLLRSSLLRFYHSVVSYYFANILRIA